MFTSLIPLVVATVAALFLLLQKRRNEKRVAGIMAIARHNLQLGRDQARAEIEEIAQDRGVAYREAARIWGKECAHCGRKCLHCAKEEMRKKATAAKATSDRQAVIEREHEFFF